MRVDEGREGWEMVGGGGYRCILYIERLGRCSRVRQNWLDYILAVVVVIVVQRDEAF